MRQHHYPIRPCFAWLALFLLVLPWSARAQQSTAITGHVSDQTGAVVVKAKVLLHNELTNQDINTLTTSTGDFTFAGLRPGLYDVSATAPGFATAVEKGLHLELEATITAKLVLKPGVAQESVTVTAEEVQLDQTHASRGEVYSADELENSPLNSGNPLLIANTEPGVIFTGNNAAWSTTWVRPFDNGAINQFSTNGQAGDTNDFQLDGSPNNANSFGSRDIGYVPPTASILEMKFISNPYDAQYGHTGGGVFDIVTKYGTNTLHGSVYENARRTWLDANTHYNDAHQNAKGSDTRDQYGFQVDGPVVIPFLYNGRDKTFFEAQFENYKMNSPLSGSDSVPPWSPGSTTQTVVDTGDFSAYYYYGGATGSQAGNNPITIYDPTTATGANGTRTAFANNFINPTLFNKTSLDVLKYYPKPNQACAVNQSYCTNNYKWQGTGQDRFKNVVARLDHNFGANDRTYIRYAWNKRFQTYGDPGEWNGIPGAAASGLFPLVRENHFFTADEQHTINANSFVELHLSFTRYVYNQNQGPTPFDLSKLGLGSLSVAGNPHVFPQFTIGGLTGVGDNAGNGGNKLSITNTIAGMPMWNYVHGKHSFKAGLDYRWMEASNFTGNASSGTFTVYNGWTSGQAFNISTPNNNVQGLGIASFLLGTMDSGSIYVGPNSYFSYPYLAPFAQDDWKLTNKLTLNLGLRWDLQGGPSEHHNKIVGGFDAMTPNPVMSEITASLPNGVALNGGLTFAGVNGQPRTMFDWNHFLVQPRIGFAYSLNNKTVIRGGFGTTYIQYPGQGVNSGFSQSTNYVGSTNGGYTPNGNTIDNPIPVIATPVGAGYGLMSQLGNGLSITNHQYKVPGAANYSFGVERQINAHTTIEVSYVGTIGFNQGTSDNINRTSLGYMENCNLEMGATITTYNNCNNTPQNAAQLAANPQWVANPFKGVDGFSTARTGNGNGFYTSNYLQANQFTRPYPQFGDITEYDLNAGRSQYDSFQVVATHRWSNALTAHGNFVWSKTMDSGSFADSNYRILAHNIDGSTEKWRMTANADWHVPVGKGRWLLGNANRIVDSAAGGWIMGATYYYQAGTPVGLSGFELVHTQHGGPKREFRNGYNLIQGTSLCWGYYDTTSAAAVAANAPILTKESWASCSNSNPTARNDFDFILRPSWAPVQNISDTGIRNPRQQQLDLSLSKTVPIYDRAKLELRFEGYNLPNHPGWGGHGYYINTWSVSDPDTGSISMTWDQQTTTPRNVQLSAKVIW
jgi:hypothetical protein